MLTPLDLNNKNFSKGFRGYDTEEVDEFLPKLPRILNACIRIT